MAQRVLLGVVAAVWLAAARAGDGFCILGPSGEPLVPPVVAEASSPVTLEAEAEILAFRTPPGRVWVRVAYHIEKGGVHGEVFRLRLVRPDGSLLEGPRWMYGTDWADVVDWSFEALREGAYSLRLSVPEGLGIRVERVVVRRPIGLVPRPWIATPRERAVPDPLVLRLEEWRAERLARALSDVLVVVLDEGGHEKVRSRSRQIFEELRPDLVDWSPFGAFGRSDGVRSTCGAMEYQEYYKAEGPPGLWERRYEEFTASGFARDICNTTPHGDMWAVGGYHMCHNGERWHTIFLDSIWRKALPRWEGFCQDNISQASFWWGGCFCQGCERLFREFLRRRWSPEGLRALGVADIDAFSMREYYHATGLSGDEALLDPLVREHLLFQYKTHQDMWRDVVRTVKERERAAGRQTPVYGNQVGAGGHRPYAVVLSPYCDAVEIEHGGWIDSGIPRLAPAWAVAVASGGYDRPVWIRGGVFDRWVKPDTAMRGRAFWEVHMGEALARGAIRGMSLGLNAPFTGDPSRPDYIDFPEVYGAYRAFSRMLRAERPAFTDSEPLADVGLVYSLASFIWTDFGPAGLLPYERFDSWLAAATTLEDLGVPYEAVIFGHPLLFDDSAHLERLARYKALLLPYTPCISDEQAGALERFADSGGLLLAEGKPFTRDECYNPLDRPALRARCIPLETQRGRELLMALSSMLVDAPPGVVAVPRRLSSGGVAVHLLNYGCDPRSDEPAPVGPVRVVLRSDRRDFDEGFLLRPGEEGREALAWRLYGGELFIMVPEFATYAVAVVCNAAAWERERAAIEERIRCDREWVKRTATQ